MVIILSVSNTNLFTSGRKPYAVNAYMLIALKSKKLKYEYKLVNTVDNVTVS